MLVVRIFAFLVVLVLVLGAAVAVQNQALLVPRVGFVEAAAIGPRTASTDCTYLGIKGLQSVPRTGPSCSLLMEGSWQQEGFWTRAEAAARTRARSADGE
jgi:hypothetical protein